MIFILEDDKNIAELVAYALKSEGLESRIFEESTAFFAALKDTIPAALVLDIMLPNENGFEVITKLRERKKTKNLPIIVLSALSAEFDKIKGLNLGADDYLAKPFSALELIARVKALLRRNNVESAALNFGALKICPVAREVSVKNCTIDLSAKEFELLLTLATHANRAFSKDELLESLWGYSNTRTLDAHISSLRRKLGDLGAHIKTIRAVGYRFDSALNA